MDFAETVFRRQPCEFSIEWYDKKSCLMKLTFTVMFELMVERGVVVNVFSYIILISGYCKSWKIDEEILQFSALLKHASQRIEARWGNLHHNFEGQYVRQVELKRQLSSLMTWKPVASLLFYLHMPFCWMDSARIENKRGGELGPVSQEYYVWDLYSALEHTNSWPVSSW